MHLKKYTLVFLSSINEAHSEQKHFVDVFTKGVISLARGDGHAKMTYPALGTESAGPSLC